MGLASSKYIYYEDDKILTIVSKDLVETIEADSINIATTTPELNYANPEINIQFNNKDGLKISNPTDVNKFNLEINPDKFEFTTGEGGSLNIDNKQVSLSGGIAEKINSHKYAVYANEQRLAPCHSLRQLYPNNLEFQTKLNDICN